MDDKRTAEPASRPHQPPPCEHRWEAYGKVERCAACFLLRRRAAGQQGRA